MKNTTAVFALLATLAIVAGCSGGSSLAPGSKSSVVTSLKTPAPSASSGSSATTSTGQPPGGTVGVTLTIRIPQRSSSSRATAAAASKRSPSFINAGTQGVGAVVKWNTGSGYTALPEVPGSCTMYSCSIVIPVPLNYASLVVVSLLDLPYTNAPATPTGKVIGQATATFTANQFTAPTNINAATASNYTLSALNTAVVAVSGSIVVNGVTTAYTTSQTLPTILGNIIAATAGVTATINLNGTVTLNGVTTLTDGGSGNLVEALGFGAILGGTTTSAAITVGGEGNSYIDPTPLVFQPIISKITVDGASTAFTQTVTPPGSPATFNFTLRMYDPDNNDVGSETDGVLDSNGIPLNGITLTTYGGATLFNSSTSLNIPLVSGNQVSDLLYSLNGYDGTNQPEIIPTLPNGNTVTTILPLSQSTSYSGHHGMTLHTYTYSQISGPCMTGCNPYSGNYIYASPPPVASIEYPSIPAGAPATDNFNVTEMDPVDSEGGITVGLDMSLNQSTQLPMANANSLCSALTSYTGGQLLTPIVTGFYGYVSGAQSFDIPYTGSTNGLCTLVVGDKNFGGSNVNNVEISIAVDNPTLVVQGKTIRAAQAQGAGK